MIEFLDPRAPTEIEVTPYTLGTALTEGMTVGFIANGFPDSENFLTLVADELARTHGIETKLWNKGNASIPAPATMLEEVRGTCAAAVAAYGH